MKNLKRISISNTSLLVEFALYTCQILAWMRVQLERSQAMPAMRPALGAIPIPNPRRSRLNRRLKPASPMIRSLSTGPSGGGTSRDERMIAMRISKSRVSFRDRSSKSTGNEEDRAFSGSF